MGAILNTIYNHYLTAYTPKGLTQYDTHKKSELRGVYNSIVKLNKESPWYLPTTNKDTQRYAIDLKENARQMRNTIAQLGGLEEDGLFNKKSAYSTDENVVSATCIGSAFNDKDSAAYTLEVHSLASPQENLGQFLANEPVRLKPDTYSFDVAINDMNYEFQFSVGEDETNREVQERLVKLINNSAVGIKASLAEAEGRTALRLTSESMGLPQGKEQIFRISDHKTSKANGTVDYFGLNYTTREASNAEFVIDGAEHISASNRFTLGKMFEVRLNSVSHEGEPVTIGLKTDVESFTDNISSLVGGYNEFMKAAASYLDSQARSRQLVKELQGIATHFGSSMESVGLTLSKEGTLSIDNGLLRQAAVQSENIPRTFEPLKGFSDALLAKSNQVSLNPMNYVEKKIVAYKNPGHNFVSPYAMSAYSGMMFNGYC
ncbi:MAG: flagellar filament capping protein FliD [Roseburia sp.]|nr:flagellar filament capping protein FliD [Roseburia sp.]